MEKRVYNFYPLIDEKRLFYKTYKIRDIPLTIFLDRKGYVRNIQTAIMPEYDRKTGEQVSLNNHQFNKILDGILKL